MRGEQADAEGCEVSERLQALEALYRVVLTAGGTPYRDEQGKVVGYKFTDETCKQIRDAVSAVTETEHA